MNYPVPTRRDHQRFCEVEGWTQVRDARGRTGTHHHVTFELALVDGQILRTRVLHPPDRTDISKGLFAHILRDQLGVTEDVFWSCVRDGVVPKRGGQTSQRGVPIPPEVAHLLTTKVGLSDDEVRRLSKHEAIARLQEYWSRPSDTG